MDKQKIKDLKVKVRELLVDTLGEDIFVPARKALEKDLKNRDVVLTIPVVKAMMYVAQMEDDMHRRILYITLDGVHDELKKRKEEMLSKTLKIKKP